MNQVNKNNTQILKKQIDENILVIAREKIFVHGEFQGLKKTNLHSFEAIIKQSMEFHPRSLMEENQNYKQIIPYLIFRYQERYFVMQRRSDASEKRLQNKYSLGIGGHIRQEDVTDGSLITWAKREFHEEINYHGNFNITPFGILNDDSNDVGKVHIGFVYILSGDSQNISIKSELKSGSLKPLTECELLYENFETWSKLVFDALK